MSIPHSGSLHKAFDELDSEIEQLELMIAVYDRALEMAVPNGKERLALLREARGIVWHDLKG